MITKQHYVEYLVRTPINDTCSNLAEHLEDVSHDTVTDDLQRERHTARHVWELAQSLIDDSPDAFLIVHDSVQDKRYARTIELVKRQYRGNEHGLVAGIGVVNMVHSRGADGDFYPIDYRIYAPDADGKTKNDHFHDMFTAALTDKRLEARTVLFDSWYASAENLKRIHRADRIFYTTLKANRLVSLDKADGSMHLTVVDWTPDRLEHGIYVRLHKVPFALQLFKLVATNGDIDWVITNDLDAILGVQAVQDANDVR